ncbi:MAG: cytochrome c oxidase subunit II [Bauldia sp.]|nr:cytochrome c oxidase subunit II [Bauldia sp.]
MGRNVGRLAAAAALLAPTAALAQDHAEDWQMYLSEPASPIMERIWGFNGGVMIVITVITVFVMILLATVMIRFNSRRNPVASKTTHNTMIEVLWTVVPVLILVGIAIPSFSLLFAQYDPGRIIDDYNPDEAITLKATGQQWFWQYDYPDIAGIRTITSTPLAEDALGPDDLRLLSVNNPAVVPVGTVVRLQITAGPTGVIHAFALPSMGVKLDAVPGRITESWFRADHEGVFYGQCSELCGRNHYNMPIEVHVVSAEQFDQWVAAMEARDQAGANALLDQWTAERRAAQVAGL